jgi:hypothetical protein
MTKKQCTALADAIRRHNRSYAPKFTPYHLDTLADFCASQTPDFDRKWWLYIITGECTNNG